MKCRQHGLPKTFEEAIHYLDEHTSERIEHVGRGVYMIIYDDSYSSDPSDSIAHIVGKRAVIDLAQDRWDAYTNDVCPKCGSDFTDPEENWIRP